MGSPRPPVVITAPMVLRAYAIGLFPMAESADDESLFWLDPDERGVFPLDGFRVSRSLAKTVRSDRFAIATDRDFQAVIAGCAAPAADRPNTWINPAIRRLYGELFDLGHAHTVEAYDGGELVGGLYGVALGSAFFGESMFHRRTDASKVCLIHLAARLVHGGFTLLDTQFVTPHLATLGALALPRRAYRRKLANAMRGQGHFGALVPGPHPGRAVLDLLLSRAAPAVDG